MGTKKKSSAGFFERFAAVVTKATGSSPAIVIAFSIIIAWIICGPLMNYSEQWQLVINTGTTIITFLMVFLIQKAQNKDAMAIQLKLNELVASNGLASNRLVDIENITEEELKVIQKYYSQLSIFAQNDKDLLQSHSIDEAQLSHDLKAKRGKEMIEKFTKKQ